MKHTTRNLIALALVAALILGLALGLSGCAGMPVAEPLLNTLPTGDFWEKVPGRDWLYYDTNTKIVYFIHTFSELEMMTPYYAPNGLPYRYDEETRQLVEIDPVAEWGLAGGNG